MSAARLLDELLSGFGKPGDGAFPASTSAKAANPANREHPCEFPADSRFANGLRTPANPGPLTAEAAPVTTVGGDKVVKTWSVPAVVPASLVATIRKWYVAPGVSPVTVLETLVELDPEPALDDGVFVPYAVVVPYSNK